MTTACVTEVRTESPRVTVRLPRREWMEAAVAAIAFILLLPGAELLLTVLKGAA